VPREPILEKHDRSASSGVEFGQHLGTILFDAGLVAPKKSRHR
jgi:hypothetical protein